MFIFYYLQIFLSFDFEKEDLILKERMYGIKNDKGVKPCFSLKCSSKLDGSDKKCVLNSYDELQKIDFTKIFKISDCTTSVYRKEETFYTTTHCVYHINPKKNK
ncbi:hypothetical protein TUBRATIS_13770 [Tubulinosema ratisbonensis]|uniref:Uncharacterized protein n=1 Tax=Tubulinosema ratisbonensis TaxID=291195 RepID=A0A437ALS1_9MICR|nr:hypothetical protein TUBRATIS_13770 [Tubulinosema ratisbonensis]